MPKTPQSPAPETPPRHHADGEYTVDELARVAGTTVRNVRAYQDRELLMPPEKRGRVGIYNDSHVARLKLVNHLLARGYTLSNIQDLIKAIDDGGDLRAILGLENAIGGRWSHERPKSYSLRQLMRMFGPQTPGQLARLAELGLVERRGLSFVARNPAMLEAAAATVREGIPARDLLEALTATRPHFDAIARVLVGMVVRHLDRYDAGALPPPTDMPELVDAIWRLRPLSSVFVESEMVRALEASSSAYLGGRVATILDRTLGEPGDPGDEAAAGAEARAAGTAGAAGAVTPTTSTAPATSATAPARIARKTARPAKAKTAPAQSSAARTTATRKPRKSALKPR